MFFLVDSEESATAAAAISDIVFTIFEDDLCVVPGHKIIRNGYFIIIVPSHHTSFILEWVIVGMRNLTLFDNEFILLALGPGLCISGLSLLLLNFMCLFHFWIREQVLLFILTPWLGFYCHVQLVVILEILIELIEPCSDPWMNECVHIIIFLIIILEVTPNSSLKSSSVREWRQLPSMPKFSDLKRMYEIWMKVFQVQWIESIFEYQRLSKCETVSELSMLTSRSPLFQLNNSEFDYKPTNI